MKKIILIDDNRDILESTQEILELANYKVYGADNSRYGLELVKKENPDLVICDIMMPDLDGYGVLHIMNNNPATSSIPFIFLTAKTDKSEIRKGMNLGADDYITKPFSETELLEAIEMRLQRTEHLKNGSGIDQGTGSAGEQINKLIENRKIKIYKKKEIIFREDDYANYIYYILSGKVKSIRTDNYGKEFVNEIRVAGDLLGYTSSTEENEYNTTAVAMSQVQVAVIPRNEFLNLVNSNHVVAADLIKTLSNNMLDRETRLLQMAYAPVRERLAATLLNLCSSMAIPNGSEACTVSISREDLANIVGTAKESAIRTLSELKKSGFIETEGQIIRILDKAGLRKTAEGL